MKKPAGKGINLQDLRPEQSVSSRLFDIVDGFDEVKKASLFLGHAITTEHDYSGFMKFGAQVCFDLLADRMSELHEQLGSIEKEVRAHENRS
jgi:hypothetical protein